MSHTAKIFDNRFVELLADDVAKLRKEIVAVKEQLDKERKKTEDLLQLQKLESNSTRESGMQFLQKQIGDAIAKNKQFFTESGSVTVPDEAKFAIITAVGGGASGGHAVIEADEVIGGCGGGASASILFYPIKLNKSRTINFIVGRGGQKPAENGTDTIIKYEDNTLTLHGGQGCTDVHSNMGGAGGTCDIDPLCNGYSGSSGTETLYDKKNKDNEPAFGGTGGSSRFHMGGIGGLKAFVMSENNKLVPSLKGLDGEFGSGGGGSSPGISKDLVGKGGNGFVYINFV